VGLESWFLVLVLGLESWFLVLVLGLESWFLVLVLALESWFVILVLVSVFLVLYLLDLGLGLGLGLAKNPDIEYIPNNPYPYYLVKKTLEQKYYPNIKVRPCRFWNETAAKDIADDLLYSLSEYWPGMPKDWSWSWSWSWF
jgi:hypothetical protein